MTDAVQSSGREPGAMSLGDHLDELRARLGLAVLGFVLAFAGSLAAGRWFAGVVLSPYRAAMLAAGLDVRLQAMQPAEPFLVYLKASLVLATLVSSPWICYQAWAFVSSGLLRHERRFVHVVAPASAALFAFGVLFFLFGVAPLVFRFFMQFELGIDYLTYQPGVGRTADFILMLALVFGVGFQMPIVIVFLERMGLVSRGALARARKFVLLGVFVLAASATPPDVVSQIALALPLYGLYEAGLLACRLWPARRPAEGRGAEA